MVKPPRTRNRKPAHKPTPRQRPDHADQPGSAILAEPAPAPLIQRAQANLTSLYPGEVMQLQRTLGNQTVSRLLAGATTASPQAGVVQRTPVTVGNVANYTRGFMNLREQPGQKSKKISKPELRHTQALKLTNDQPVPDQDQQDWFQVEVLSGDGRGVGGYVPTANFNSWGQIDDTELGQVTAKTALRDTADKKGAAKGALSENTAIQVIDPNPTNGYIKVRVLSGSDKFKDGFVRKDRVFTENLPLNLKTSKWFHNKNKQIVGKEKIGSSFSRLEAEESLVASVSTVVAQIIEALTSGLSRLSAYQRIAFLISGQPGEAVEQEFKKQTGGKSLKVLIIETFNGDPGPYAHLYLLSVLKNNGLPTLKDQIAMAMGLVDSSGSVPATLAKIPEIGEKIGSLGDEGRILELYEAAPAAERMRLWQDALFMDKVKAVSKKVYQRIGALVKVDEAEKVIEDKKALSQPITARDKQKLAEARDEQLAVMFTQRIKELTLTGTIAKKVLNKSHGVLIGFESKKFQEDLVAWKAKATVEDLIQIKKTNSAFQQALKLAPTNFVMGLPGKEREFILEFLDQVDSSGSDTQVKAVKGSLERQKKIVNRGTGKPGLGARISTFITERKWAELETEISLLSLEQREELLKLYDPNDPQNGLQLLLADLKAAGLNKEERAGIKALFQTAYGQVGENYIALWQLVEPNKRSRGQDIAKHLNPKKWSKLGGAFSGESIGAAAFKLMLGMEGEEYAQVRQDRELLQKIKAKANTKTWDKIMTLLGMADENDQLTGLAKRQIVVVAEQHAEHNPKHWALKFDEAIDENLIKTQVTVGRDKAPLYVLAVKTQAAARAYADRDKINDPEFIAIRFMQEVLSELGKRDQRKLEYLEKRVVPVYEALHDNKRIEVGTWLARAKHEGFGIGEARKVDRQKVVWGFTSLSGRQLLDEWSNLNEFKGLNEGLKAAEQKLVEYNQIIMNTPKEPTESEKEKNNEAERKLQLTLATIANIQQAMKTFTLGIKPERMRDLKAIGVKKEDRVKMEAMVTDKLIEAMKDDDEVQKALDEVNLPYDKYMQNKMKGIDALQSQRVLDTTRQWSIFSTLGSQLDESTRKVKGTITSSEIEQRVAEGQGKDKEDIKALRKAGAKKAKAALTDRNMVEARFKDMQATFKARAMAIFKLIAFAIVTALSAGMATPLAIGVQIAIEAGLEVLQGMFRYYVLGETDIGRLVVDGAMGLVSSTVRILTGNLAMAMNSSFLHPNALGQLDWLGRPIARSLGSLAHSLVMFMPEELVKQLYHDKALEKVVEEGEDKIADDALDQLVGDPIKGFLTKVTLAAVKNYGLEPLTGGSKAPPPSKTFDQAYNDRLIGGGNPEEQQKMWAKYERSKQKGAKKAVIKALTTDNKHEKKMEKTVRKENAKEIRGKSKSPGFEPIKEAIANNKEIFKSDPGMGLLQLVLQNKLSEADLRQLTDSERGKLEESLEMEVGQLDPVIDQVIEAIQP